MCTVGYWMRVSDVYSPVLPTIQSRKIHYIEARWKGQLLTRQRNRYSLDLKTVNGKDTVALYRVKQAIQ